MSGLSQRQASNPFPGLRPFQQDEDYLFFGRENQVIELLSLLRSNRFLAVVGTSGSGKSSLVRAGLIPALHRGAISQAGSEWEILVMRPEATPLENLARTIADSTMFEEDIDQVDRIRAMLYRSSFGLLDAYTNSQLDKKTNLLVIVDQFEELFRFRRGSNQGFDQANHFVNLLLQATQAADKNIYVILTMRSDYLGDCSVFPGLAEAVNQGEYLIPRLSRAELKTAIVGPVQVGGATIANRLVQRLLNNISDNSDQLPILQHALMRTWTVWLQNRTPNLPIDIEHFDAAGGMERALSQHAGEIYDSLTEEQQRITERVFRTLTEQGADNRGIRRPTRFDALTAITNAEEYDLFQVIDAFRGRGRTFLMPTYGVPILPETMIDISHESLMRVWDKLREWVERESQSVRIYRRLAETAVLYAEGKSGLFRDPDLRIALTWRERNEVNEHWGKQYHPEFASAMAFLDKSKAAQDAEEAEKELARQRELAQAKALADLQQRRAEEQQKSTQRFRRLSYFMGILAVISVLSGIFSYTSYRGALNAQKTAETSRTRAMQAAMVSDWNRNDRQAVQERLESIPKGARDWEWQLLNAGTKQFLDQIHTSPFQEDGYYVGLSSTGRLLATRRRGGNEDPIELYDLDTGKQLSSLKTISSSSGALFFSDDDQYLAYQHWGTPGVQVYHVKTAKPVIPWNREHDYLVFLGFGQNNTSAFLLNRKAQAVECIRLSTGKIDWSVELKHELEVEPLRNLGVVNNQRTEIAMTYFNGKTQYLTRLNLADRTWGPETKLSETPNTLRYTPNDAFLVVDDGSFFVQYDASTLKANLRKSVPIVFRRTVYPYLDAEQSKFATFGAKGMIEIYDDRFRRIASLSGASSPGSELAVNPEKHLLISAHSDGSVYTWDMRAINRIPVSANVLATTAEGRLFAGVNIEKEIEPGAQVTEFDSLTGHRVRSYYQMPPAGYSSTATDLRLARTKDRIAVTRETGWGFGRLRMFDRTFGNALWDYELTQLDGDYTCFVWNKDESLIALGTSATHAGNVGNVAVLESETGEELAMLPSESGSITALAFSNEKDYLITARSNGKIALWDWRNQRKLLEKALSIKTLAGISAIATVPKSSEVYVALGDGNVAVWDSQTGDIAITRKVHGQPIVCMALHPGGRRIVTIDRVGAMKILDSDSLEEQLTLEIEGTPQHAIFNDSGDTLFVASATGIQLFSAIAETEKKQLRDQQDDNSSIAKSRFSQLRKELGDKDVDFAFWQTKIANHPEWADSEKRHVLDELQKTIGRAMKELYANSESQILGPPFENDLDPSALSKPVLEAILKFGNDWSENRKEYYQTKRQYLTELCQHIWKHWDGEEQPDLTSIKQFVLDWNSVNVQGFPLPKVSEVAWIFAENPQTSLDDQVLAYFAMDQWLYEISSEDDSEALANLYNTASLAEYRVGLFPLAILTAEKSNENSKDPSLHQLNAAIALASASRIPSEAERDKWSALLSEAKERTASTESNRDSDRLLLEELQDAIAAPSSDYKLSEACSALLERLEHLDIQRSAQVAWLTRLSKRMKTAGQELLAQDFARNAVASAREASEKDKTDSRMTMAFAYALQQLHTVTADEDAKREAIELIRRHMKEADLKNDEKAYIALLTGFVQLGLMEDGIQLISAYPSEGKYNNQTVFKWFIDRYLQENSLLPVAQAWPTVQWGPLALRCDYAQVNNIGWNSVKNAVKDKDSIDHYLGLYLLENANWYDFNSTAEQRGSCQNSLATAYYRCGLYEPSLEVGKSSDQLDDDPDTLLFNRLLAIMSWQQLGNTEAVQSNLSQFRSKFRTLERRDMDFRSLWSEFSKSVDDDQEKSVPDAPEAWRRMDRSLESHIGGIAYLDWKTRSSLYLARYGQQDLAKEFMQQVASACEKIPMDDALTLEQQAIVGHSYAAAYHILQEESWKTKSMELWKRTALPNDKLRSIEAAEMSAARQRSSWYRANSMYLCEEWNEASESLDEILSAHPDFIEARALHARVTLKTSDDPDQAKQMRAKLKELVPKADNMDVYKDIFDSQ